MLRIRKLTDYAFVVLVDINRYGTSGPRSAQVISQSTSIPLTTVSKVLQGLGKAGLVESTRGFCGGYSITKPASDITATVVIEAMEGPVGLTECASQENASCSEEGHCAMHWHWPTINSAVREALGQVTLQQMSKEPSNQKNQLLGRG